MDAATCARLPRSRDSRPSMVLGSTNGSRSGRRPSPSVAHHYMAPMSRNPAISGFAQPLPRRYCAPACAFAPIRSGVGWPRDREDFAHIGQQRLAEIIRRGRQRPPLVPHNRIGLAKRLSPVGEADDLQIVAMGGQDGWHDRNAVAGLGERQQVCGVRLSNATLGLNSATRQAASNAARTAKLLSSSRSGCDAEAANVHAVAHSASLRAGLQAATNSSDGSQMVSNG